MTRVPGWSDEEREHRSTALARLIRRAWRAIARSVAARVETQPTITAADATDVSLGWLEELNGPVLGYVRDVYMDSAEHVVELLDAPGDVLVGVDLVNRHLERARNRLRGVGDDVWSATREQLIIGRSAGESTAALAARVRAVAGVSDARSLMIARTEVHAAAEAGAYDQALFVDPNATKVWLATNDSRTREAHRRADGQRAKISEPFTVGGAPLRFPGDPLGPADETVNCRCSVAYDFDIVTSVDPATSDEDLVQVAAAFDVPPGLVAAGGKWNPQAHPRGSDGKFIKKGAVSHLLSTKKPLLGDVAAAVNDLTPASWGNLTKAQQDYITASVNKLPEGSKLKQDLSAKLVPLIVGDSAVTTPSASGPTSAVDALLAKNGVGVTQGDIVDALESLDPPKWDALTADQKSAVTTQAAYLSDGAPYYAKLKAKLTQLARGDEKSAVTKTLASVIPAHKGAAPGSPAKVTTTLIWGKYEPGTVILEADDGSERVIWNGKKYVRQSQLPDGTWSDDDEFTKKDAYAEFKNTAGWVVPNVESDLGSAPTPEPTPAVSPAPEVPAGTFKTGQSLTLAEGKKYLIDTTHSPGTVVGRSVNDQERLVASDVPALFGGKFTYRHERLNPATGEWDVVQENIGGIGAIQILRGGQQSSSAEKNWLIPESTFNPTPSAPTPAPPYVADKAQWQKQWEKGLVTTEEFEQEFGEKPVELTVTPTPTGVKPDHLSKMQQFGGLKKTSGQKGSNPGGFFEGPDGKRWYVKQAKSPKHAANEVAASALYNLAGIETPQVRKGNGAPDIGGGLQTGTELVPGANANLKAQLDTNPAFKKKLQQGFVVDAWLANWDVAGLGFDNVVTGADGNPHRIDVGGALLFRAMGTPKGAAFGSDVTELETLRDPKKNWQSATVFGDMTEQDVWESAQRVTGITDAQIDQIVHDSGLPASVAKTLKERRDFIAKKYPPTKPSGGTPPAPTAEEALTKWLSDPATAPEFVAVIDAAAWNKLDATEKKFLFGDVGGDPALKQKLIDLNGGVSPLAGAKKAAKKVAKKVPSTSPAYDKDALLAYVKNGSSLNTHETVFLVDNMTVDQWSNLTDSQKVQLTLNVDTALDNAIPGANNAFQAINAFKAAEANNAANVPKPLSYSFDAVIDDWNGLLYQVDAANSGTVVALSGDGQWKLVKTGVMAIELQNAQTGAPAKTYSFSAVSKGQVGSEYPGDWIVPPLVPGKPSPAMAIPTAPGTTTAPDPGLATPLDESDWMTIANEIDTNELVPGQVVGKSSDGEMQLKVSPDGEHLAVVNLTTGVTEVTYNSADVDGGAPELDYPGKTWVSPFAPSATSTSPVSAPVPAGSLSPKTIFAVGLTGGQDGDIVAVGESSLGSKYRLKVKKSPSATGASSGKTLQLERQDPDSGVWMIVDTLDSVNTYDSEWGSANIAWNPPPPKTTVDAGDGSPVETEEEWIELLATGPYGGPTVLATTEKGDFQLVAHSDNSYMIEEKEAGTGSWVQVKSFTVAELDDDDMSIGDVMADYTSQEWYPGSTPAVVPTVPATPAPAAPSVPATAPGDISKISHFVKTKMKVAFKGANTGYWSKPEKIWDVIKKIQAQFPDPDNPGQSQLSPLQILKSMDSLHMGKDPSPYETKMTKWATSAKGLAYIGNAKVESPGGISTGPKTAPPTPFTAPALWASLESVPDGGVVATADTPPGTQWQFKKFLDKSGKSTMTSYYKKPTDADWKLFGPVSSESSLESLIDNYKMTQSPGSSAPTAATPTSASVPAAGKLDMGTGDISHMAATKQQALYAKFKKQPATYLSSPDTDIYSAAKTIADEEGISLLQMLRVIDAVGAQKVSKPDEHLFEKKVLAWLKTPKGAAVASGKPIPVPDSPKYSPGVDPKNIMSFEQSSALSYGTLHHAKALALTTASKAASPAGKWTAAQQAGLRTYTGGTYYSINAYYRGKIDTISPTHEKAAKNAQLAMRPATEAFLVHRGVGWDGIGGAKSHADVEKMVGQTWRANGFMSTSIGGSPAFGGPVMIEVEVPPGTPMAYVEAPPDTAVSYSMVTQHPGEREIVLGAGLHYKIISAKKVGGKTVVRVRVVPPPAEEVA